MKSVTKNKELGISILLFSSFFGSALAVPVDVELALLVDVSGSISRSEFDLQRQGYVEAFDNEILPTIIRSGETGSIAATLVYWSGSYQQSIAVPWTPITNDESAKAFADQIAAAPRPFSGSTAVGSAINFSTPLFDNEFEGTKQIIDVSGDGVTNSGANTKTARDNALSAGVDNINGLVIGGSSSVLNFYQNSVQGGLNSFTVETESFTDFSNTVKEKIGRETLPFDIGYVETRPDLENTTLTSYKISDGISIPIPEPDKSLPTIVLTHGWQPDGDFGVGAYPLPEVADALMKKNAETDFNLVTYDWKDAYTNTPLTFDNLVLDRELAIVIAMIGVPSAVDLGLLNIAAADKLKETEISALVSGLNGAFSKTQAVGSGLAVKLLKSLGEDYDQSLQFIGHSLGTAVNSYAINTLTAMSASAEFSIDVAQNTILDAATAMQRFDKSLFYDTLPTGSVSYVDNYYGSLIPYIATGSPIPNTNPGDFGKYLPLLSHNGIHSEYYAELIGSENWVSTVLGEESFQNANYQSWETPTLLQKLQAVDVELMSEVVGTAAIAWKILDGIGNFFINATGEVVSETIEFVGNVVEVVVDVVKGITEVVLKVADKTINLVIDAIDAAYDIGEMIVVTVSDAIVDTVTKSVELTLDAGGEIVNYTTELKDKFLGLFESSPTVVVQEVTVPKNTDLLSFDLVWDNTGDGDWLTLHFNDQLLWSFIPTDELLDQMISASVSIPDLAGETGSFYLTLNSVGESNARVFLKDFNFKGIRQVAQSAPEPATFALMGLGLAGIGYKRYRSRIAA